MKKILSMLLCVFLVLGLAAPTAFAAGGGATVYTVTAADPSPLDVEINNNFVFDVYISGTYDEYTITFPSGTYYTVNSISAVTGVTVTGNQITAAGLGVVDGPRTYIATVNCTALSVIGNGVNLEVGGIVSSSLSTLASFSKGTINFSCSHGSESAIVTTQPTCTTAGEKTHTCTICGHTWTSALSALGHTWSVWTDIGVQHKHTCTRCTITEQSDHTWENGVEKYPANCVSGATLEYDCPVCGLKPTRVEGLPTDHTYVGGKAEKVDDATHKLVCDGCGVANGAVVAHTFDDTSYTNNGATHIKRCTADGCTFEVADSHIWVAGDIVSAATCNQKAKREWTCVCGASEDREEGETTSHTYNNGKAEKVDDATHKLVCDGCGIANGAVVAHTFDDASYTNNGATHTKKCSADGCTFEVAESHAWVAGDIVSAATCNQKAKRAYTCLCGASENREEGETTSHTYGSTFVSVDGTSHQQVCDGCGVANGATSAHTFVCTDLGNGFHKKECSACHYSVGSESHNSDWSGGEVTEAATCISKAKKKYTCNLCGGQWEDVDDAGEFGAHNFASPVKVDSAKHKQTCSVCSLTETVAHTFPSSWIDNGDGLLHNRSCSCGETEYVPHTWDTGVVLIAPTDTSTGVRKYTCTGCGKVTEEPIPMTDHEHSYSKEWKSDGSNHWKACACGDKVEIKPHTFDEGKIEVLPTCKTVGKKIATCTVCGEEKTVDIPLVDHTFSEATVTKEPTCTTAGEKTGVCTVCGATESAGIPALGHTAGEFEVTLNATCKEVGKKVQKCTTCGAVLKEEAVPMTEHNYGEWVDENGISKRECSDCGAVDSKVIEKVYVQSLENDKYGFKIYAVEGDGFLGGWRLMVQEVTRTLTDSERASLVTGAKALNNNYFVANTFDIWLEDGNGNRVEYSGKMKIELPKPLVTALADLDEETITINSFIMTFVNEDGGLEPRETEVKIEEVDANSRIDFKTEGLGRFCLLGEQPTGEQKSGLEPWLIILIAVIAVLVPAGAFFIIFFRKRKEDEEDSF